MESTKRVVVNSFLLDALDGDVCLIGFGFDLGGFDVRLLDYRFNPYEIFHKKLDRYGQVHYCTGEVRPLSGESVILIFATEDLANKFEERISELRDFGQSKGM